MDVLLSMAAQFVVAATFLLAAWAKLRDFAGFAGGLHDYGLLPPAAERLAARLIPAAEVVVGTALLLGIAHPWPALAAAALSAIFGAAIAITARRGRDIPCHCFGTSSKHRVGSGALLRVAVLMLLALTFLRTSEDAINLMSLIAIMMLAVVLAEPFVLLLDGVREARRRIPGLQTAELARRGRMCRTVTLAESDAAP